MIRNRHPRLVFPLRKSEGVSVEYIENEFQPIPPYRTYQVPHKRRGDQNVGDRGECEPNDDDDFELREPSELWDHSHCDGCTQPAAYET